MIRFRDSEISQILPDSLANMTEAQCLSYAINKAMRKFVNYCSDIGVYAMIDYAPNEILDLLAVELNTQFYEPSLSVQRKRDLIKGTLVWFMHSGTPSAVEELIAAVFGEGQVSEWFTYGDNPYYFKISTNAQLTPDIVDKFTTIIHRVKNVRSRLRSIEIHRDVDQHEKVALGAIAQPHYPILNNKESEASISGTKYPAAAVISSPKETVLNNMPDRTATMNGSKCVAAAVVASPHITITNNS